MHGVSTFLYKNNNKNFKYLIDKKKIKLKVNKVILKLDIILYIK